MLKRVKKHERLVTLVLSLALIAVFHPQPVLGEGVGGPAFSEQGYHVPEEGWEKQPVTYADPESKADLVVDMNQQLYPFLEPIITRYAREQGITVEITEGTCGKSAGKLARKEVDIGAFCCPPGELDRLPGLRYHTLGISPLAFLVQPENPVDTVSWEEARSIFQGDIDRWSQVGGPDLPIKPIASLHCGKRPGHWRLLLDNADLFSSKFMEIGDMPDQIRLVSSTAGSIGYETLGVAGRFRDKGEVKALAIDGRHPSDLKHLRLGNYPFYRVFNVTSWEGKGVENRHALGLIEFLLREVENLDSSHGLIPSTSLRQAGWEFSENELTGEPERNR